MVGPTAEGAPSTAARPLPKSKWKTREHFRPDVTTNLGLYIETRLPKHQRLVTRCIYEACQAASSTGELKDKMKELGGWAKELALGKGDLVSPSGATCLGKEEASFDIVRQAWKHSYPEPADHVPAEVAMRSFVSMLPDPQKSKPRLRFQVYKGRRRIVRALVEQPHRFSRADPAPSFRIDPLIGSDVAVELHHHAPNLVVS